jgi:hypothetical protein
MYAASRHEGDMRFQHGETGWLLLGILCLSIILKTAFFTGFQDDDIYYASQAHAISKGQPFDFLTRDYRGGLRLGLIAPAALIFKIMGPGPLSAAVFPALCSLGMIIIVFLLGRTFADERGGLCAALMYCVLPLDAIYSTSLYPDIPAVFFCALSFFIYTLGHGRPSFVYPFCAGCILGDAYLIKETSLIMLPVYGIIAVKDKGLRGFFFLTAGVGIIIAAETFFSRMVTGAWMNSLFLTASVQGEGFRFIEYERKIAGFFEYPRWMLISVYQTGLFFYAGIAAFVYYLIKPQRRMASILIWAMLIFAGLQFGSSSFDRYVPLPKQPRYLLFVAVPFSLLIGAALSQWSRRGRFFAIGYWCFGIMFAASLCALGLNKAMQNSYGRPVMELGRFLADRDAKMTYVSWDYYYPLRAYFGFSRDQYIKPFCGWKSMTDDQKKNMTFLPRQDTYVVNNLWRPLEKSMYYPVQLDSPPASWQAAGTIRSSLPPVYMRLFGAIGWIVARCPISHSIKIKISATIENIAAEKTTIVYYVPAGIDGEDNKGV